MPLKSRICALSLVLLLLPVLPVQAATPTNSAVSAVLIDCDSGRILYQKNPNEQRLIASITKLMTALVAVESQPDLAQRVKIKAEWTGAEGSSLYLKPNEDLSLETLLYGLLLHSGNDAAVAIAGFCAGDTETFVEWMNRRASDLGMTRTHFQNPNGLNDEQHYSTALDMARLAAHCMQNETLAKIVATKSIALEGRSFTNHNKLLWQYANCVGMKTGYTQMAGRTLITSARKDGQTLAVVTLSDPNDWADHKALFDYGFETFTQKIFVQQGDVLAYLPVEGSLKRSIPVYAKDSIAYPIGQNERTKLVVELPERLRAPITEGEIAGSVRVTLDGKSIGETYLLFGESATLDVAATREGLFDFLPGSKASKTNKTAFQVETIQ